MKTIHLEAEVQPDGTLALAVPSGLSPGPVEVLVVLERRPGQGAASVDLSALEGLGKELWEGVDAQEYVRKLRDEWNP